MDVTGFYWLGARYYEHGSGRFLSPDPAGHGASMSLYDYAGGDPVNAVDPNGRLQKQIQDDITHQRQKRSEDMSKIDYDSLYYLDGMTNNGAASEFYLNQANRRTEYLDHLTKRHNFLNLVAGGQDWESAFRDTWDGGRYVTKHGEERAWAGSLLGPPENDRDDWARMADNGRFFSTVGSAVAWSLAGQAFGVAAEGLATSSGAFVGGTRIPLTSAALTDEVIDVAQSSTFVTRANALGFSDEVISNLPDRIRAYGNAVSESASGGFASDDAFLIGRTSLLSTRTQRIRHELTHVLQDMSNPGLFTRGSTTSFGFRAFYNVELQAYKSMYGLYNPVNYPLAALNASAQAYPIATKAAVAGGLLADAIWLYNR